MGAFAQSLTPQGPPPGPISNPDQDSLPSATLPGQPAQPSVSWNPAQPSGPANQTPDDQKQGMFHKLFSKLSGQDVQYDVDPSTGQMLAKPVQEKPGELFRNILAAGLMGSQGIDHAHGQNTFAQGLLAGAGAGVKESRDMAEKQDAARRQQAQQNYENQLKANREQRENKKLSMQEEMDKVVLASEKIKSAALVQSANQLGYDNTLKGQMAAANIPVIHDAVKADTYNKAGMKPLNTFLQSEIVDPNTGQMTKDFLDKHPKYLGDEAIAVGTTYVPDMAPDGTQKRDANGILQYRAEALWGVYNPVAVVTDGQVASAKASGMEKSNPTLFKNMVAYNQAWHKNGSPDPNDVKANDPSAKPYAVPYTQQAAFMGEVQKSRDLQGEQDKHLDEVSKRNKDAAESADAWTRNALQKRALLSAEQTDQAENDSISLFNQDGSLNENGKNLYNLAHSTDPKQVGQTKKAQNRINGLIRYQTVKQEGLAEKLDKSKAPNADKTGFNYADDFGVFQDLVTSTTNKLNSIQKGGVPKTGSNGVTTNPEGPVKIAPNGEKVSPGQPTKEPAWDNHAALVRFTDPKTGVVTYSIQHSAGLYDPDEFEGGIKAWYKRTYGKEPGKDDIKFSGNESGLLLDAPENATWADKSTAEAAEKAQRKANATSTFAN